MMQLIISRKLRKVKIGRSMMYKIHTLAVLRNEIKMYNALKKEHDKIIEDYEKPLEELKLKLLEVEEKLTLIKSPGKGDGLGGFVQDSADKFNYLIDRKSDLEYDIRCYVQDNEEAYENIIMPLSECTDIFLRKKGLSISVCNKRMHLKNDNELITEFYEKKCPKYLEIKFQTPTAFKSDGKYVIYPDLGLIYASLMRKYSAVSEAFDMFDEETLEALVEQSEIVRYRLQTVPFPLEKVQITGFTGSICIHIRGPETMARYLRMLFKFGEFAGVGIKTGMGMGAMKYVRRNEDD